MNYSQTIVGSLLMIVNKIFISLIVRELARKQDEPILMLVKRIEVVK